MEYIPKGMEYLEITPKSNADAENLLAKVERTRMA